MDVENPVVTTLAKLELVNEIRSKTLRMLKMKEELLETLESSKKEENYLKEYRTEMENLIQEKMSHVEELRQIHSDINAMESIIKQTEVSRASALDRAKKLHSEFLPIKNEVDRLRSTCLGLERLPDLHEEDPDLISSDFMSDDKKCGIWQPQIKPHVQHESIIVPNPGKMHHHLPQQQTPMQQQPFMGMREPPQQHVQQLQQQQQPKVVEREVGMPSFTRQAPPPMKSCLSCHQQIHRNAPICPLCKAKSRSRNPKKPKNKKE